MLSLINILGLALVMTFALIIFIWVIHETSFDRFHTKGDQIYQVRALHTDNHNNLVTGYETTLKASMKNPVEALHYD